MADVTMVSGEACARFVIASEVRKYSFARACSGLLRRCTPRNETVSKELIR
jgi:hypothetical protein